jgi:hypothetical protein
VHKRRKLSRKQLAVIDTLFSGELDEQAILDKHNVSRRLYNEWQDDDAFIEHFERRIASARRQRAALIAKYAPLAAAKLVQLTECDKEETARKACIDIISMPLVLAGNTHRKSESQTAQTSDSLPDQQLTEQTASRILAVLAQLE